MITAPFFVMLLHPNHRDFVALLDEHGEQIMTFETEDDAIDAAKRTSFGSQIGYRVFHIDEGLSE